MAGVLNDLGQTIIPSIFSSLNGVGLVDTMTVKGETTAQGTGGGMVKSAASNVYTDVPVSYKPIKLERRLTSADKLMSIQQYIVTFPTHSSLGTRYDIDAKAHRLVVNARGNEPVKTFRIVSVQDDSGVVFECVCERENT